MKAMTVGSQVTHEMVNPSRLAQMSPTDGLLTPLADGLKSKEDLHSSLQTFCLATDTLDLASSLSRGKIGGAFKAAMGIVEELMDGMGADNIMDTAMDTQDMDDDSSLNSSPSPSPH